MRWLAIAVFCTVPFILGLTHLAIRPPTSPSEATLKSELLAKRGPVDTVIVGDSRILRVGGPEFEARGWTYVNLAMSGLSPEDTALQLEYALAHYDVMRVVLGTSFESLSEKEPYENSRYYRDPLFANLPPSPFRGPPPKPQKPSTVEMLSTVVGEAMPIGKVAATVRWYRLRMEREAPSAFFRDDGTCAYSKIIEDRATGHFDSVTALDPRNYFLRPDSEARYLETQKLSDDALQLYARMFALLRARGISTVVVETGRTAAYQKMIDDSALLTGLQQQWRAFLRSESAGSVKVLMNESLHEIYDARDFFDAAHYVGGVTEPRLNERIAAELALLDVTKGQP